MNFLTILVYYPSVVILTLARCLEALIMSTYLDIQFHVFSTLRASYVWIENFSLKEHLPKNSSVFSASKNSQKLQNSVSAFETRRNYVSAFETTEFCFQTRKFPKLLAAIFSYVISIDNPILDEYNSIEKSSLLTVASGSCYSKKAKSFFAFGLSQFSHL